MRIVLISGLSNNTIRNHLELKKGSRIYKSLINVLGLPTHVGVFSDKALWVTTIINDLKKRSGVELHVLAPHIRMKRSRQDFVLEGVQYHYFSAEWSSFMRLLRNYRLWKLFQNSKRHTKYYLDQIKPDIVLLSGAENPVSSGSIFGAKGYPRICLCQTVYNDPDAARYNKLDKLRQQLEIDIFNELECFGVYCGKHYNLLRDNSVSKLIFRFNYPDSKNLPVPLDIPKNYDFVNFALVHSAAKGTPDSIKALAIVKKHYPKVTLNIVGGCDNKMRAELDQIIHENGLEENVVFTPFFERREDLLVHIQKSRFGVLPCKVDNTSGTMSQCMNRKMPIIVYKTAGTPEFNKVRQCALIAEMDDVEGLAQHMITLMSNPELAKTLAENGRWYKEDQAQRHIDNWGKMVECFPLIIDHYKNGTPIPPERLYNPEEDI